MLLIGVFVGPFLKDFASKKGADDKLTTSQKETLNKESQEAFYDWFLSRFENKVAASKRLATLIERGKSNKMPQYTLNKLVLLMEINIDLHDVKAANHTYELMLELLKNQPEIIEELNLKDVACIAYGHLLAAKAAGWAGNYEVAENRFARADELIKDIKELRILKPIIYQEEGWFELGKGNPKQALEKFEKVKKWQKYVGTSPLKQLNTYVNLCYLAHITDQQKKLATYAKEAKMLLPPKRRDKKDQLYMSYKLYLIAAQKLAINKDDPYSKKIMDSFWRMIAVNSIR